MMHAGVIVSTPAASIERRESIGIVSMDRTSTAVQTQRSGGQSVHPHAQPLRSDDETKGLCGLPHARGSGERVRTCGVLSGELELGELRSQRKRVARVVDPRVELDGGSEGFRV